MSDNLDPHATLPPVPRRRASDAIVDHLHGCVEGLKNESAAQKAEIAGLRAELAENTAVTKEVRDILATFKVIGAVAKWVSVVAGAVGAAWTLGSQVRDTLPK